MNGSLRVLVIGESLMDIVVSLSGTEEHVGGSPLNVAVGLARLNDQPHLLIARGADSRGQSIADYLRDNRVEVVDSERIGRTSTALARLAVDGDQDELAVLGDFAAHVASITASRRGANPPNLAEVQGSRS